jgi:hypothetical protein
MSIFYLTRENSALTLPVNEKKIPRVGGKEDPGNPARGAVGGAPLFSSLLGENAGRHSEVVKYWGKQLRDGFVLNVVVPPGLRRRIVNMSYVEQIPTTRESSLCARIKGVLNLRLGEVTYVVLLPCHGTSASYHAEVVG